MKCKKCGSEMVVPPGKARFYAVDCQAEDGCPHPKAPEGAQAAGPSTAPKSPKVIKPRPKAKAAPKAPAKAKTKPKVKAKRKAKPKAKK